LPEGQVGNSEVGHLTLGAGKIVPQELCKINTEIKNKSFFKNKKLKLVCQKTAKEKSVLHILGLVSDGGVHSHINHLFALLKFAKQEKVQEVQIHVILDGRDTPPGSGILFLKKLKEKIKKIKLGKIASISGRYYAMDRDNNEKRIKKSAEAIKGSSKNKFSSEILSLKDSYKKDITDEFFKPCSLKNRKIVNKEDKIIFFNFRPDRAKQLTEYLINNKIFKKKNFICFVDYNLQVKNVKVIFNKNPIKNTVGEILSNNNLRQLRIAETEKYAHVTSFFNGGQNKKFPLEERILIPSPKVKTYDLDPGMSAKKITKKVVEKIKNKTHDIIILNFANADMVGHTGNFEATVKAIEIVDLCIGKIYKELKKIDGTLLITADHGNAEKMLENGKPFTAHTANPVPFCVVNRSYKFTNEETIADVARVILNLIFNSRYDWN
jgi:2,3-bisphosphoglycerate-independent phosphoglycerate mutase